MNSFFRTQEVDKKEIWENFLLECDEKTFLDSWNWGEFQKMMGNKIWRLGVFENDELVSVALVMKIVAKRGTFLFVPHGPTTKIFNFQFPIFKLDILKTLLDELKKIASKEKCSFIRIAPIFKRNEENIKVFKDLGFREAPIYIHPEITWELDIRPSEQVLLRQMRKTTRYLIHRAPKDGVEVFQSKQPEDLKKFNQLYQEVAKRHHFIPFSLDYLKKEFLAFLPDNQISLSWATYKREFIASGLFIFWSNIGFYHHGASSLKYPKVPASYLLQWEVIKEAKRRGCKIYNFWGIAHQDKKSHPWAGLTLFKKGFGGYKKEYVKTQDLPISKKYWLTYIIEKARKIKRGV